VTIHNAGPAIGFTELPNTRGLIAWLFPDQLVAALDREIDAEADDSAALSGQDREKREATILSDLLANDRDECALIELERDEIILNRSGIPKSGYFSFNMLTGGRPAWMGRAYSVDLRERVVAAVERGGLSCHQAAAQFGVGISTAILWVQRFRRTGSVAPDKIGGYKPRKIADAHREWLVRRCREADFTLRGLVAELGERGLKVDYRSVWEFVHREKLSHKKRR
jgi:putative transposase